MEEHTILDEELEERESTQVLTLWFEDNDGTVYDSGNKTY